jgi:hypothetical protein
MEKQMLEPSEIKYNKATIVSIAPFQLINNQPGMTPIRHTIPAADPKVGFSILHVNNGYAHEPIPLSDPIRMSHREIYASDLAYSIIYDRTHNQLSYGPDAYPGLFFVPGHLTVQDVLDKHKVELKKVNETQNNWFMRLVMEADDDWQKYHQHRMITSTQRLAAKSLGLKRDWITVLEPMESPTTIPCPACFTDIHPDSLICANCKTVLKPAEHERKFTKAATTK